MPATNAPLIAAGTPISAAKDGGKVRINTEVFTLATDVAAAYDVGAVIPIGAEILGIRLMSSVSLGSSTIALGIAGTAAKYRAAATFTSVDTWVEAGSAAVLGVPLTAAEQLILTVAAASLPASGRLLIEVFYVDPS